MIFTRRGFIQLSLFALGIGLSNCYRPPQQQSITTNLADGEADLVVWWEQGFLPAENEQITQLVKSWERQLGLKVNLKLLPVDLINQQLPKLLEAPEKSRVPDIVYSVGVDTSLAPKLAWWNQLLDLSDLIDPIKQRYTSVALSSMSYRNKILGERRYYALPLWQSGDYIHYWGSRLQEIDLTQQDIPKEWDRFWQFWQTAQMKLRAKGHSQLYGLGLCMSAIGFDTYTSLMMFLDAHGVVAADQTGQFLLEEAENRQRFINALEEYTGFYLAGYVPPAAAQWLGSGNNNSFLNGEILMTQNLTLSIPLTQKLERNQYNQDGADRYRQIVTIDRPHKLDGTELLTRKGIKQAIVPKASRNPAAAKAFLSYLIQPENLNLLIKGFKGRVFPVMPELLQDPFWRDATDPHLLAAMKIYDRPSLTPYEVLHSAFSEVQNQQLWAKTVLKVIQDNSSPAAAVDWAIAQMKQIWTRWEKGT